MDQVYYVLIGRRYVKLLGSGSWTFMTYRSNGTEFPSYKEAAKYAAALNLKGHEASVSGPWKKEQVS